MNTDKIKLILVDDHLFFRKSIVNLLKRYERIDLVGEANNGEEYLQKIQHVFPDVALMDVKMNRIDGILTTKISNQVHPEIKIIALTYEKGKECTDDLIKAGVKGILFKDTTIKEIVEVIITVFNGNYYFAKDITKV